MRKLLAVALLCIACNDDPPGGIAGNPDASPPGPPDAAPEPPDAAPPDATPLGPMPNLVLVGGRTVESLYLDDATFGENSCSLFEMCVGAPGDRRLLRFDTVTANIGDADLELGQPSSNDELFEWSECHMHYHFSNYAVYELVGAQGVVATGRKQAFCLEDTDQLDPDSPGQGYNCQFQGISAGWADAYTTSLPCQWIDVTGVAPGQYTLRISINPEQILPESRYDDNTFEMVVDLD